MEKVCFECSDSLRGRSDKKFCSDSCRNAYNNRHSCDANNFVRNVNNVLRRNRRILQGIMGKHITIVNRFHLIRLGFDFKYYTHIIPEKEGDEVYFCYEYGYRYMGSEGISIVRDMPSPDYNSEPVEKRLRKQNN